MPGTPKLRSHTEYVQSTLRPDGEHLLCSASRWLVRIAPDICKDVGYYPDDCISALESANQAVCQDGREPGRESESFHLLRADSAIRHPDPPPVVHSQNGVLQSKVADTTPGTFLGRRPYGPRLSSPADPECLLIEVAACRVFGFM